MAKVIKSDEKPVASKTDTRTKKQIIVEESPGVYIDPLSDFGFKRLFGDKELMINFLNSVLKIKDNIEDLHYSNTVRTGISKDDRSIIFDLLCTTGKGERIIVEMQTMPHDNYKERTVYYASRLIQEQAKRGKEWNFSLKGVYSVNIVNFCVDEELSEKSYLSHIQLMYKDILRVYYDKLTIVYLELPRFTKKENELKTNVEQWTYALKYLPKLDRLPANLRNKVFEKFFELARIAKMSKKEQNAYYKSLHDMSIVKFTFSNMENKIAELQKQLAEYQRMYGALEGTTPSKKPAPRSKVRSRNSAKARATANT